MMSEECVVDDECAGDMDCGCDGICNPSQTAATLDECGLCDGYIDADVAKVALDHLGIDNIGLDDMDRRILNTLIEKFSGGPVGVKSLAIAIGEDATTIEDVYEPFLIKEGFMQRTSRGRVAQQAAFKLLGKKIKINQQRLFK